MLQISRLTPHVVIDKKPKSHLGIRQAIFDGYEKYYSSIYPLLSLFIGVDPYVAIVFWSIS